MVLNLVFICPTLCHMKTTCLLLMKQKLYALDVFFIEKLKLSENYPDKAKSPPPPNHVYIGDRRFKGKNNTILGKINRQSEKTGLRMHHLHPLIKNSRGDPEPPTILREDIKIPSWALFDPLNLRWKFPHHVYRSFEGKIYTEFWGRNQHEFCKKGFRMHHLDPIIKNVPGEGPAGPKPAGVVSPFRILPQAGLRADFVNPPPPTHTHTHTPGQ